MYYKKIKLLNLLKEPLKKCSCEAVTGYYRDGFCVTGSEDVGKHIICCIMTDEFLRYSLSVGNNLVTSRGEFEGLIKGNKWCLCISRWIEALKVNKAPPVILEASHYEVLNYVDIHTLKNFAYQ